MQLMMPKALTLATTAVALTALLTGCGGNDDDSESGRWSAEDVQGDIARGVASDLGVDQSAVHVSCPDGLDPTAKEVVEMACTATVDSTTYKVEVVADETDNDKVAFRWRLINPTEGS